MLHPRGCGTCVPDLAATRPSLRIHPLSGQETETRPNTNAADLSCPTLPVGVATSSAPSGGPGEAPGGRSGCLGENGVTIGSVGVHVAAYDPGWPGRFEAEQAILEQVLAPWLCGGIHHIGSTAVPGLAAKPVLDMIAGVRDLDQAAAAIGVLSRLSYAHAPHRPRALWFCKPASAGAARHAHHLHLTEPGNDLWQERLAFRCPSRRSGAGLAVSGTQDAAR